jgi:hypothetical protein
MDWSRDRWFAPFEGTRPAWPVALFRIAFFGGLALHFFPALMRLDDAYARGALRSEEWSHWLWLRFTRLSPGSVRALAVVTMIGIVMGIVGLRPRVAAMVAGVGLYLFASFNGLPVHTLAIVDAWGILLLFAICGGGSAAWSLDALFARRKEPAREPRLLPALLLYQTLLAVFCSGVEKLAAGWLSENEMGVLLAYPKGFLLRDWVVDSWLSRPRVGWLFTWLTLVVELGAPFALSWRRTRLVALVAWQLFFLGIIAMLEVPPLFYCMFAFGAVLVLDAD